MRGLAWCHPRRRRVKSFASPKSGQVCPEISFSDHLARAKSCQMVLLSPGRPSAPRCRQQPGGSFWQATPGQFSRAPKPGAHEIRAARILVQQMEAIKQGTVSKLGAVTLRTVLKELEVGSSAATHGTAFRADCRVRRNEPGGGGGHPLQTSA